MGRTDDFVVGDANEAVLFAKPQLRNTKPGKFGIRSKATIRRNVVSVVNEKRPSHCIWVKDKAVPVTSPAAAPRPIRQVPRAASRVRDMAPGVVYSLDKARRWEIVSHMNEIKVFVDSDNEDLEADDDDNPYRSLRVGVVAAHFNTRRKNRATDAKRAHSNNIVNVAAEPTIEYTIRKNRKGHREIVASPATKALPNTYSEALYDVASVDRLYVVSAGYNNDKWNAYRQTHHRHCEGCHPRSRKGTYKHTLIHKQYNM